MTTAQYDLSRYTLAELLHVAQQREAEATALQQRRQALASELATVEAAYTRIVGTNPPNGQQPPFRPRMQPRTQVAKRRRLVAFISPLHQTLVEVTSPGERYTLDDLERLCKEAGKPIGGTPESRRSYLGQMLAKLIQSRHFARVDRGTYERRAVAS